MIWGTSVVVFQGKLMPVRPVAQATVKGWRMFRGDVLSTNKIRVISDSGCKSNRRNQARTASSPAALENRLSHFSHIGCQALDVFKCCMRASLLLKTLLPQGTHSIRIFPVVWGGKGEGSMSSKVVDNG